MLELFVSLITSLDIIQHSTVGKGVNTLNFFKNWTPPRKAHSSGGNIIGLLLVCVVEWDKQQ